MALSSPALVLAEEALWANIKPTLDVIRKLGATDFSATGNDVVDTKPGATLKVPISSVSAASEYNADSNNYTTGGDTNWASLTCTHYLQGFDITGTNLDQGCDAPRMKQLFASRAGTGVSIAARNTLTASLDGCTASTGCQIPAAGSAAVADYLALGDGLSWLDKATSVLAVNGTELAAIKAKFAAGNITGTVTELGQYMGFRDMVLIPGMTARACIVPASSLGFKARVPRIIADFPEFGTMTDPDSGLSVGIVVASVQATNKLVVNADLWFGSIAQSANAGATTAGIVKVGTAS